MRLSGSVNGQHHRTMQIALTRISDLVDPSMGCFDAACAIVASTKFEISRTVTQPNSRSPGKMEDVWPSLLAKQPQQLSHTSQVDKA